MRSLLCGFYIILGEPDEINKSSSGEVGFYQRDVSFGNHIDIEFAQDSMAGEFRIRQRPKSDQKHTGTAALFRFQALGSNLVAGPSEQEQ